MITRSIPFSRIISAIVSIVASVALHAADGAAGDLPPAADKTAGAIPAPEEDYSHAIAKAEAIYRKSLAKSLEGADQIEVFLLDYKTKPSKDADYLYWFDRLPADLFPIIPYKATSKILRRKVLSDEERKLLIPAIQRTLVEEPKVGAMCHFPVQGIRILSQKNVIFQTSICWHCGNIVVEYPVPINAGFLGFEDAEFKEVMSRLMPIPQREIDRFNEEYGIKPKNKK